jgi:hypothetical protein
MKHAWLLALILISPCAFSANDSDNIKLVTTGQIKSIDTKHKTFQFLFRLDERPQFNRGQNRPPFSGPGRRGGGRGRIGGYPGRTQPRPNDGAVTVEGKEVKVFVSDATAFKTSGGAIKFSDLKNGERITITAIRKGRGDDLIAQTVALN